VDARIRRGQAAEELLANPLLRESLAALREDLNTQLLTVRLDDVEGQKRIVMAVQMSGAIERYLKSLIRDGDALAGTIQLRGKRID
jgi:hypothetical protein